MKINDILNEYTDGKITRQKTAYEYRQEDAAKAEEIRLAKIAAQTPEQRKKQEEHKAAAYARLDAQKKARQEKLAGCKDGHTWGKEVSTSRGVHTRTCTKCSTQKQVDSGD
jgi:hypothetical protein